MNLKTIQIIPDKAYLESSAEYSHVNVQDTGRTHTVYFDHNTRIAATLCTLDTRIVSSI